MFNLKLIDFPELVSETTENGRVYTTPEGNVYPSVTTVLGKTKDQTHLNEWRKRIGEKTADWKTKRAADRGTKIHSLCEKLILNQSVSVRQEMPVVAHLFSQIRPVLLESVNNVLGLECPLYSDYLGVAGRVDLVSDFNNKRSIIDFKTSDSVKRKEWIEDYFLQTSIYAVMFEERTGVPVSQLVVVIANEQSTKPSIFIEKRDAWIKQAISRIESYKRLDKISDIL